MAKRNNRSWNLESFLDSFILELDKARETLAIKGMSQPLTYTVKDVSLDLHLFPEYNGRDIRFTTAGPGEEGASKVSIQLGSITDRQIRQTTKEPVSADDVALEEIDDLDTETKQTLQKIGISSVRDLEKLEERNVKLEKVPKLKRSMGNYQNLAERLKKIRTSQISHNQNLQQQEARKLLKPSLNKIQLSKSNEQFLLRLEGKNLLLSPEFQPSAHINQQVVEIIDGNASQISIRVAPSVLREGTNEVNLILDPYAIVKFNVK